MASATGSCSSPQTTGLSQPDAGVRRLQRFYGARAIHYVTARPFPLWPCTQVRFDVVTCGSAMLTFISGLAILAASVGAILYFKPRDGKISPVLALPVLEIAVALTITTGLALGVALMAAGLFFR